MSIRLFGSRAECPSARLPFVCFVAATTSASVLSRVVLLLMAIGGRQERPEDRREEEKETANGSQGERKRDEIRIVVVFVCDRLFVLWMRRRWPHCCSCMWIFLWVDIDIEIFFFFVFASSHLRHLRPPCSANGQMCFAVC